MFKKFTRALRLQRHTTPPVSQPLSGDSTYSSITTPPVSQPLSGDSIYSYITDLEKSDRKRLDDEVRNRGLSFGDLRVDGYTFGIKFRVSYEKSGAFQLENVEGVLRDVIARKELFGVAVENDGQYTLSLILGERAPQSLHGIQVSGWKSEEEDPWGSRWSGDSSPDPQQSIEIRSLDGKAKISCDGGGTTYQRRVFLEIGKMSGHGLSFTAHSAEALDVILEVAEKIGLQTEPAEYADESSVPLSHIVEYAYEWYDKKADKYYTEIKYILGSAKSTVYLGGGGWHQDYEENGKNIMVRATEYSGPKLKLNNRIVETERIQSPTRHMRDTREYIRGRVREINACRVDDCGRKIAYEINVVKSETGESSRGSIYRVCNNPRCIAKIKKIAGGIRATVYPARKEVW